MTRLAFLGTPEAAVPSLTRLSETVEVALVVTRPDRPRGRSAKPQPPPVKEAGEALGLEVAQPSNAEELAVVLASCGPLDVGVVVAFGRILAPSVLALPALGMLNVHFSLLPRWRGAAPVERALMAGDTMTGVTIIKLNEGLDTGPVLTAQAVDIHPTEDAGSLTHRLAELGSRLLTATLDDYLKGHLLPVDQVEDGATYADKITADDRLLDTESTASNLINRVRALAPSPGARMILDGEMHKVLGAARHPGAPPPGKWEDIEGVPVISCRGEGVEITRIQSPGRSAQAGDAWVRGRHRPGGTTG